MTLWTCINGFHDQHVKWDITWELRIAIILMVPESRGAPLPEFPGSTRFSAGSFNTCKLN